MQKEKKPVFFLDSGAGGLPYFRYFHDRNPSVPVIYVADRAHFPYGVKSKEEITAILLDLAEKTVLFFQPEIAVLACNTASVSALPALREKFGQILWVGTVPAIKPAVLGSKTHCVGVLGTNRTIEDSCITELAEESGADVKLIRLAAPDLVDFAEHNGADATASKKRLILFPYIEKFRESGADGIVLGCTHFLLLLDSFRALALPDITIYDSRGGVIRRVESFLQQSGLIDEERAGQERKGRILLTGNAPIEPVWKKRAEYFGMDIFLWDEFIGS